jgi:hypothetical protein
MSLFLNLFHLFKFIEYLDDVKTILLPFNVKTGRIFEYIDFKL